jgi:hypothetical protein
MLNHGKQLLTALTAIKVLVISKRRRDPLTERIQKIVFPLLIFVANSKSPDLACSAYFTDTEIIR